MCAPLLVLVVSAYNIRECGQHRRLKQYRTTWPTRLPQLRRSALDQLNQPTLCGFKINGPLRLGESWDVLTAFENEALGSGGGLREAEFGKGRLEIGLAEAA